MESPVRATEQRRDGLQDDQESLFPPNELTLTVVALDDSMLKSKKFLNFMEPLNRRIETVERFLRTFKRGLIYDVTFHCLYYNYYADGLTMGTN